jgi:acyl carrier protein
VLVQQEIIMLIWAKLLEVKLIGIQDDFFKLGGDSMVAVQLFDEIEEIWGQNLPLATLFENKTIKQLATVLRKKEWVALWSSLVCIQTGENQRLPLFCIHPVGGNILEYHTLANYLGKKQAVHGLQSQGLDGNSAPLQGVEDMAAPELPNLRPSLWQAVGIHLQNLWQLEWPERLSYVGDRLTYRFKSRDEKDFLANILYKLDNLTPELVSVLNANLDARKNYKAKKYPGKVNLFRCCIQDLKYALHPESGWQRLVSELEIHPIVGAHFSILKEPRIQSIAQELKLCLQSTQSNILDQGFMDYNKAVFSKSEDIGL